MNSANVGYLIAPFVAWFVTGILKFCITCSREKRLALDLIGYGGMPSNHSAIVSCTCAMVAMREGIEHPAFAIAITLAFIVVLDANSLRGQLGRHATMLNKLNVGSKVNGTTLRERMGHSPAEIAAGILVGGTIAVLLSTVLG